MDNDYLQFCLPVKVKKSEFAIDGRENVFVEVVDIAKPLGRGEEHGLSVNKTFLVTSAIRIAEAEEYRNALKRIWSMSDFEVAKIFGSKIGFKEVLDGEPASIIRRLEEYDSRPKTGEVWKHRQHNDLVVIRDIGMINGKLSVSYYWQSDGDSAYDELELFKDYFCKTEGVSRHITPFMKELKGLKDELFSE